MCMRVCVCVRVCVVVRAYFTLKIRRPVDSLTHSVLSMQSSFGSSMLAACNMTNERNFLYHLSIPCMHALQPLIRALSPGARCQPLDLEPRKNNADVYSEQTGHHGLSLSPKGSPYL